MFRNKRTAVLSFSIFLFLFFAHNGFAASKVINSLSLDFTKTQDGAVIKGKVTYCKNPFLFIFEITAPEQQIMYVNSQGAYALDSDTIYDISGDSEFLLQTCDDFLNWFKQDLGLYESDFTPSITWLEEGQPVTQWDCSNTHEQPINKILAWTDSYGRFTQLKMYMDSDVLVTHTLLDSFEYAAGFSYPTLITSVAYENDSAIMNTELYLSNVKFNFPYKSEYASKNIELVDEVPADLSFVKETVSPVTPSPATYRVSIPSVLVNSSFKFYKKFITNQDMTNCPFYPSCSQYMLEAVSKNGLAGFIQGLERLKRCTSTEHKRNLYPTLANGKHYDPVPEKGADK